MKGKLTVWLEQGDSQTTTVPCPAWSDVACGKMEEHTRAPGASPIHGVVVAVACFQHNSIAFPLEIIMGFLFQSYFH